MQAWQDWWQALGSFGAGLLDLLLATAHLVGNYWVAIVFVLFWLVLVRWEDLHARLNQGAWIAFLLLFLLVGLVWGVATEPTLGNVPSLIEKLLVMMGAASLTLLLGRLQRQWTWQPASVTIAGPPEEAVPASDEHASS